MSYLIPNDLNRSIQDVNLQQIISGNPLLTLQAQAFALTEVKSYLSPKYNIALEFTDSVVYNPASIYFAMNRVYLDAPAYSATATYILNQLTLNAGLVYYCTTVIPAPEAFTPAHWTLLGSQYDMFFASYPFPLFDLLGCYKVGDHVFWNGHTYTCKIATQGCGGGLQYVKTYNIPYKNVFPDAANCSGTVLGSSYWTDNGAYSIPAGSLLTQGGPPTFQFFQSRRDLFIIGGTTFVINGITYGFIGNTYTDTSLKGWTYALSRIGEETLTPDVDYSVDANGNPTILDAAVQLNEKFVLRFYPVVTETQTVPLPSSQTLTQLILTYFTKGDNRNQQLVTYCLDIMIYTLYRRIPPAVVPEIRIFAYQQAKQWLNNVAKGNEIVADIPKLQAPQGQRVRMGSNVKSINTY